MKMNKMLLSHLELNHSLSSMKKMLFEIALKGRKQIAAGTYEFIFEKSKDFHFNTGQHVQMALLNPSEIIIKVTAST